MQQKQTSVYFDLCACVTESFFLFFFGMKVITLHWISPVSCSVDSLMMTLTSVQRQTIVLIVEPFQEKSTKARRIEKNPGRLLGSFVAVTWRAGHGRGRGRGWQEVWRVPGCSFAPQVRHCLVATKQSERPEGLMDTLRNSNRRSLLANTASISQESLHKILNRNLGGGDVSCRVQKRASGRLGLRVK